jgi:molybdopterin molybdotransferase
MISVDEARALVADAVRPLPIESCPLVHATGRVLAAEVRADVDWPPFDTSAMDGYAVRLADLPPEGTSMLERPGVVAAGDPPPREPIAGEAVRVMTGAPLPPGTEAVIPVERSRRENGAVSFAGKPAPGSHIRRRGESVSAGTILLEAGRRLSPGDIALAALAGAEPIGVHRRPRVRIVTTGNELVPASGVPVPGQLRDSNGPMLAAACAAAGWPADLATGVADDVSGVDGIFAPTADPADVLVTCGGVSAGDFDLLPAAASRAGFETIFAGVAMQPGKPIHFGRRGGTLWFGLPGNPVSSAVTFHLFVREALARLEGDASPGLPTVTASLEVGLPAGGARESYRDAAWRVEAGQTRVRPVRSRGSHDLAAHSRANALIRRQAAAPPADAGSLVTCLLLAPAVPSEGTGSA